MIIARSYELLGYLGVYTCYVSEEGKPEKPLITLRFKENTSAIGLQGTLWRPLKIHDNTRIV